MTDNNAFERFVADHLADDGSGTAQAERLAALIDERTGGQRQWPQWLAFLKEPPMRTNSRVTVGSPTVRVMGIVAATLLLMLTLAAAGAGAQRLLASDGPIVVAADGSGDHTTIGDAVAAADDGDTIEVRPGTYVEAVVIEKSVTLRGDGEREQIVISAPEDGPVYDTRYSWTSVQPYSLVLVGSAGELSNLTFSGPSSRVFVDGGAPLLSGLVFDDVGEEYVDTAVSAGLVINGGATPTVRDNRFIEGGGIDVFQSSTPTIADNEIATGAGIFGQFGDGAVVRGNRIETPGENGIVFRSLAEVLVEDNVIVGKSNGIGGTLGDVRIIGNTISDSVVGIESGGSAVLSSNTLRNNDTAVSAQGNVTIEGNTVTGGGDGIIVGLGAVQIRGNTIEAAAANGVHIQGPGTHVLEGNSIRDSDVGILVSSSEALVSENELTGNRIALAPTGGIPALRANTVTENEFGIGWKAPKGSIEDNTVTGNSSGIVISGGSPVVSGNQACDNGVDLEVVEPATPDLGENEICEDAATE